MLLGQKLFVAALAAVSVVLHGCGSGSSVTTTTTKPGPSPPAETTTTKPGETTTTTTVSQGGNMSHCKTYDGGHSCTACDDGFDLNGDICSYHCTTDTEEFVVKMGPNKGLCLDDSTFQTCADEIPHIWPNTMEKVKTIRLFSAWQNFFAEEVREKAWKDFIQVVKKNGIKVLVGTQITCNETDDDRDWKLVLELLKELGPEHIMGLAVGNELELLFYQGYVRQYWPHCINDMWKGGYFWRATEARVRDMDALGSGYAKIPVTSVFGAASLGGEPFFETENAMCTTYLKNATAMYGQRWAFSLNVYPYLDPNNHLDPGTADKCDAARAQGTCLDKPTCMTISILSAMRRKMHTLTGTTDSLLWVGETGWSSPQAYTLNTPVAHCPDFSNEETFETNYKNFLSWDMTMQDKSIRGPDHMFYFTMRDSMNFGNAEYFGLVKGCGDSKCKLQKKSTPSDASIVF